MNAYTVRVRYFVGINTQFANSTYYEQEIAKQYQHYDKLIEIKKEYIFEKDYKSKCLTMYTVQSE